MTDQDIKKDPKTEDKQDKKPAGMPGIEIKYDELNPITGRPNEFRL